MAARLSAAVLVTLILASTLPIYDFLSRNLD